MARTGNLIRDTKAFSDKLKKIRIHLGMSQMQAAQKLETSYSCYNSWENGNRLPRMSKLREIAEILQVPLSSLMDDDTKVNFLNTKSGTMPYVDPVMFAMPERPLAVFTKGGTWQNPAMNENSSQFALHVNDPSMQRDIGTSIQNGSAVICERNPVLAKLDSDQKIEAPAPLGFLNSVAVISLPGRPAMIREISNDGDQIIATPWNPQYQTLKYSLSEIRIWGRVIGCWQNVSDLSL